MNAEVVPERVSEGVAWNLAVATQNLRKPFPASETGQLPRGGTTLAYVGHAAITGRLLDVDPEWWWAPMALDERGLPLFDVDERGNKVGLWIRLGILGVQRLGYGSCPPGQFDAVKVLVGDALRNAAMRFGVALDLWVKGSPELPQDTDPERPYMSGLNISAFLSKCSEAGCTAKDIDAIVLKATDGRAAFPEEVFADEVTVLRAAFESWANERAEKATSSAGKPGKSVPKKVVETVRLDEESGEYVTDLKHDGTLI